MNKHLYRIVFNHALGVLQVVSELVRRPGRVGAKSAGSTTASVRRVSLAVWVAFGWVGVTSMASAQVAADPNAPGNQRPTVLGAPGTAPLINIQTPSAAGVSRNTYRQFDVGKEGAVLNNSRTNTSTQLAGSVPGNPWLATGTAKVILNEVNSSNPSQLNGYIEVAGDRAQVVIANPAGIACDGCGFLNASRATLTTGTPQLAGGALDGYRVEGGAIRVNGAGLDASRTDYTDLIARSLEVNAGIWAPQLQVTAGANLVSADVSEQALLGGHTQLTVMAGASEAPAFALDVGALGGMYAGKITLLGTEHGVGVRNAGTIGAQAGDLVVTVDGRLENTGSLQSQVNASINAQGGVANAGTLSATRELSIITPNDVENSGGTLNAARIAVDAGSLRNAGGAIAQTSAQGMSLEAGALSNRNGGRIGMPETNAGTGAGESPGSPGSSTEEGAGAPGNSGGDDASSGGSVTPSVPPVAPMADGVLRIAGLLDNDGGRISATSGFNLTTNDGLANDDGQMGLRQLTLTGGNLSNRGGTLTIGGASTVDANQVINDGGQLTFAKALAFDAKALSNRGGIVTLADPSAQSFNVAGTLDNTDGTLASNASQLTLISGSLINERGTITHAGTDGFTLGTGRWQGAGGMVATASAATIIAGTVDHQGATLSATQLTLTADNFDNRGGTIAASDDQSNTLRVVGTLDNGEGGAIQSNGDLTLTAGTLGNASGSVQHAGKGALTIDVATLNGQGGVLASNGVLTLTGNNIDVSKGTTFAQQVHVDAGSLGNAGGSLTAFGSDALDLRVRNAFDNAYGSVTTNGALQLRASSLLNTGGMLAAAGTAPSIVQVAGMVDNTNGMLAAMGATTVRAGTLLNQGGAVQAAGGAPLQVIVNGRLDNSAGGLLATDGDLTVTAATLDNAQGVIQHAGQGTAVIQAATLQGTGGTIASNGSLTLTGGAINLRDGTTTAQQIAIDADSLTTAGGQLTALSSDPLRLTVRGALDNTGGSVNTNGALQLNARSLTNTEGTLMAAGTAATKITVAGAFDNMRGTLATAGATTVHASHLDNTGGTVQAASEASLAVTTDGALVNDDGTLVSNGALALTAGSLSNRGGGIQAQQGIDATIAGTLDNSGGVLIAGDDLTVHAQTLLNRDTLSADTSIPATGLYGQRVSLDTNTFDNTRGHVQARDALSVTGTALSNADGVLDGTGEVRVTGSTIDNSGGQLIQRAPKEVPLGDSDSGSLTINIGQALTNTANGLIGAEGNATVHAGTLDNSGGITFARHDLNVSSDGDLLIRNGGQLHTNGALTLTANGTLDNSGGTVDATGAATVSAGTIANVGGNILAGSAVTPDVALQIMSVNAIDNRGGTLGNRGGDVSVLAASADNSAGGKLVAQRDLQLDTTTLNNAGGTAYAARNLSYQNANGTLDNTGGQLGAGDTAWLTLGQVTNTNGGRIQADTVWLTTPVLNIDGGEVGANALHAQLAAMGGLGRLSGTQLLDAHFTGNYTHQAGQRLESDGVLSLTVDGTLNNQGTLQTSGELDVSAIDIVNQGTINASATDGSAVAHVMASGTLDNQQGADLEGDTLVLRATAITNTGNISGDVIDIDATILTNGRDLGTSTAAAEYGEGFIGASQVMNLHIGSLANLDAQLYSGGDLIIAGSGDSNRAGAVENLSGRIQAEGNLSIAADSLVNARRGLTILPVDSLSLDEQAALLTRLQGTVQGSADYLLSQYYCPSLINNCDIGSVNRFDPTITLLDGSWVQRTADSVAAQLIAGQTIEATVGRLLNSASAIAAGGDLTVLSDGDILNESGTNALRYQVSAAYDATLETCVRETVGCHLGFRNVSGTLTYIDTLGVSVPDSNATVTAGGVVKLIAGGTLINAGSGAVSGAHGNVTRSTVDANGSVGAVRADGLNGPGSTVLSNATDVQAGHAGRFDGTQGQAVSAAGHANGAAAQVVGTADQPLPGYVPPHNGMVNQHADPSSPFLITTAPRFAKGASTSSDYLLRALGTDPGSIHKRLGDGYYEQSLVMDQLLQLTGRRTVNGGDGLAQYQALMDGAASEAARLGLTLGAPLTTDQIASLSSDIVWLVDQVVDGQHVLVPVVYLSKATADRMRSDGALIAGDTVDIQSSGTVRNDGTISGSQGTRISADTLINTGALSGGDRLAIATRGDTINAGTMAAKTISIVAGGSVVNAPIVDGLVTHGGTIQAGTGGVQIVAAQDVFNAGKLISQGDALVVAGRDAVQTATGSLIAAGNAAVIAGRDAIFDQSTLSAGKVAYVDAGRDAVFNAATVNGGTGVGIVAGRDILSDAVTDHRDTAAFSQTGKTRTWTTTSDDTVRGSAVTSGGDVTMQAGRDINLLAAIVRADGAVGLVADRDINLAAGENIHTETQDTKRGKTSTHSEVIDTAAAGTTLSGALGVVMGAGRDINAVAAMIASSDGAVVMHADRDINLLAGQDTHSKTVGSTSTKKGFLNRKTTTTHDATFDTTAVGTTIIGANGVALDAGRNVLGVGTTLTSSAGGIAVSAGDQVAFLAATDTHSAEHSEKVRRSGVEWVPNPKQGTQKKEAVTQQVTAVGSRLDAAGPVVVVSGGDQTYQAANIKSDTGTALISDGAISFVTATNSNTYQRDSSKHNVAYQGQDHRQRVDTTEVQTSIIGPVAMAAADGITIGVGQKQGETPEQAIARASQQQPGTAWLADMQGQNNVSWQSIDEVHIDEHQHHEGMSSAAGAVVTIVAAYFTAGAASAWIGGASGAAAGSGTAFAAGTAATSTTAAVSAGWPTRHWPAQWPGP